MKKFYHLTLLLIMASVSSFAQSSQSLKDIHDATKGQNTSRHTFIQTIEPSRTPNAGDINPVSNRQVSMQPVPSSRQIHGSIGSREASELNINEVTGGGIRAVTDLTCPQWSAYSQQIDGVNAISVYNGAQYDNILSDPGGRVLSITWWMREGQAEPTLTFDIILRSDNGSGQPGAIITSFPGLVAGLDVTVTNTGETFSGNPVFEYTYEFPFPYLTINVGDWIGILDYPEDHHHHWWLSSSDGDSQSWAYDGGVGYLLWGHDLAFCLGGRESALTCPTESVFSQLSAGTYGYALTSEGFMYDNVYNPTIFPMAVGSLTWWMQPEPGATTPTFDIVVRADDSGEPGILLYSFPGVTATETNTGETWGAWETYEYTYNFPSMLIIQDGDWIGIRYDPDTYLYHFWCMSLLGDGTWAHTFDDITYYLNGDDLAFCLGAYEYDLFCPEESIYAQITDGQDGWSGIGAAFYDNILTTLHEPVVKITWWMAEATTVPSLTFDIIFREDNSGAPGNLITSFTNVTATAENTGEIHPYLGGIPIYKYTYIFPTPVDLSYMDWVGINDYPDNVVPDDFHHYWCTSPDGDGIAYFDIYFQLGGTDFSFCLSPAPLTPISTWAIGIGIFLIIAFTILRFRKLF